MLAIISVIGVTSSRNKDTYRKAIEKDIKLLNKEIEVIRSNKDKLVTEKKVTIKQVNKIDEDIKELEDQRFELAREVLAIDGKAYTTADIEKVVKKLKGL